jgi:hypothetical protein
MKSKATVTISTIKRYITRSICGLFVMLSIWQGMSLGVDTALAAESIERKISDSTARIAKQVANTKERLDSGLKDSKDPAKSLLDTAQTGVKINTNKAERPINDTPELVKQTSERNSKQAEKFSENITKKIKQNP